MAEVHVAGPYSWVASGGGILYCVLSSLLLFLCFCWFPVSCSSHLVFEVFIGVHWLALIWVRFLFLLFVSSSLPRWMPMHSCVPFFLISLVMHKGSLMQMKNNTTKKWCKNRFLSSTWRWPPRVKTCCSNFNLHNYTCVDGNFYVIYNKLKDR